MNFRWNQLLFSHHIGEEEGWRDGGGESIPSTAKSSMNFRWNQLLFGHHIGEEEWWREGEESLSEKGVVIEPNVLCTIPTPNTQSSRNTKGRRMLTHPYTNNRLMGDDSENFANSDSRNDDIGHEFHSGDYVDYSRGRKRNNNQRICNKNSNEDLLSTVRSIETCYLDRSHSDRLQHQDLSYFQCLLTALTHSTNIRSIKLSNLTVPIVSLIDLLNNCTTVKQFIMFQAATPTTGNIANSRDDDDTTTDEIGSSRHQQMYEMFRSNSILIAADEDPNRSVLELAKAIVSCQSLERIELLHNVLLQNVATTTKENSDINSGSRRRQQGYTDGPDNQHGSVHSCIHLAIGVLQCVRRQAHHANPHMRNSYKSKICHFHAGPWKLSFDIGGASTSSSSSIESDTLGDPTNPYTIPLKVSLEYDKRKESASSDSMRINELFAELSLFGSSNDEKFVNPISEIRISMVRTKPGAVVANQDDNDNSAHDEDSTMNQNVIMSLSDLLLSSSNAPQSIHISGMVFDQVTLPMLWRALSSSKGCRSLSFSYCWFNVDIHQATVQRQLRRKIDSLQYLAFIENSCRSDSTATVTNNISCTTSEVNLIERIALNMMMPTRSNTSSKGKRTQLQVLRCTGFSAQAISAVFEEIIHSDLQLEVLDFGTIQSPPFDGEKVQSLCKYVPLLRRLKHLRMSLLTSEIPDDIYQAVMKNSSLERFDVWEAQSNLYYQISGIDDNGRAIPSSGKPYALQNKKVDRINSVCERNKRLKTWQQQPDSVPEYLWTNLFRSALDMNDAHDQIFRQLMSMSGEPPVVNVNVDAHNYFSGDNHISINQDRSYDEGEEDNAASWLGMIRATITALT